MWINTRVLLCCWTVSTTNARVRLLNMLSLRKRLLYSKHIYIWNGDQSIYIYKIHTKTTAGNICTFSRLSDLFGYVKIRLKTWTNLHIYIYICKLVRKRGQFAYCKLVWKRGKCANISICRFCMPVLPTDMQQQYPFLLQIWAPQGQGAAKSDAFCQCKWTAHTAGHDVRLQCILLPVNSKHRWLMM